MHAGRIKCLSEKIGYFGTGARAECAAQPLDKL